MKKRIASALFEKRHLREAGCIRALCDAERDAIREFGLKNPVAVIPNGVVQPDTMIAHGPAPWEKFPGFAGARIALSLGRLHPKKNLPALLRAWRSVVDASPEGKTWRLVIAGWDEGGHEVELKQSAAELGLGDRVGFCGPLYGLEKEVAYRCASAFIIPSLSEGLPMVVLEAWSHGLPVMMTAECNLPEGFQAHAALRVASDPGGIAEGLHALLAMTDEKRIAMGRRGRELTERRFSWNVVGAEMNRLLSWMIGQGPRPGSVAD